MDAKDKARLAELKAKTGLTDAEKTELTGLEVKAKTDDGKGGKDEKTFTQKQVNDLIKSNTATAVEKLLKDLGVDSMENMKDGLAKLKLLEDGKKTDMEKLQDQIKTLTDAQATNATDKTISDNKIALMGAKVPADKVDKYMKLLSITDGETMNDKIKSMLEDYPLPKAEGEIEPPDTLGGKTGGNEDKTVDQISVELDDVFGIKS